MIYAFYVLHVLISLFLILVVLLQQGKGADLSVFGGGGTMTAFGARGAATLLHKLTVGGFVAFIITTLVIGILQGQLQSSTVMSDVDAPAAATAAADADDATGDDATESDAAALPEEPVEGAIGEEEPAEEAAGEGDTTTEASEGDAATTDSDPSGDSTEQ